MRCWFSLFLHSGRDKFKAHPPGFLLDSLRRPHSPLGTGRKSQLSVCAWGKASPRAAGQACSFLLPNSQNCQRSTEARTGRYLSALHESNVHIPVLLRSYLWIFCKTSSEIITKDCIQACFCKEGQSKSSCTDTERQGRWKHFSFKERRQKKTTTKKVPRTSIVALATGEFANTNTHKYSPDSSALGFKILQTGREHMSCVRYRVSNQTPTGQECSPPHTQFNLLTNYSCYIQLILCVVEMCLFKITVFCPEKGWAVAWKGSTNWAGETAFSLKAKDSDHYSLQPAWKIGR